MRLLTRLLLIGGLGATLIGGFDAWLLIRGSAEPEQITVRELGKKNGTRNVHLTITEFAPGNGMVIEQDNDGTWKRMWIPLLTPDGNWTERPIVAFARVSNQQELDRLLERSSFTGVVTNGLQSLGKYQQEKLAVSYPNKDLSGAIAFQIDRRFPSPFVAYPLTVAGLLMFGFGLALLFGFVRARSG